ncbi:MAG: hypothetical protein Q8N60_02670, partial [Candidatus Diapherotrites archaeon]|nr:hypothetical protein [Candidatus Diapherotrites archaeon]
ESKIIAVAGTFSKISLKYITESLVEKTKDRFFILNLAEMRGSKEITVILPESATLKYSTGSKKDSVIPAATDISTDGNHILVDCKQEALEEANSLFIMYKEPAQSRFVLYLGIILISAAVILVVFTGTRYFLRNRGKQTKPADEHQITRNLFEEEKAIVDVLLNAKNHELWQKGLLFETGISKVRLSRKLRALEKKGLIEKIPFGNTNKIRLKQ